MPTQGEVVEARVKAAEEEPFSWWEATVTQIKGGFCKVRYVGWEQAHDDVVELEALRPSPPASDGKLSCMKKQYSIGDKMHAFLTRQRDPTILKEVLRRADLISVRMDSRRPFITLIGGEYALRKAVLMFDVHVKHLSDLQRLQAEREMLLRARERLDSGAREEFDVRADLIGLVVGKAGKNIDRVKAATGVYSIETSSKESPAPKVAYGAGDAARPWEEPRDVLTPRPGHPTRHPAQVAVVGPTPESVAKAREMLEFAEEDTQLPSFAVSYLVGRNRQNLRDLEEKAGLVRATINKSGSLRLLGTRLALDQAKLLLDLELNYLSAYAEESAELRRLSSQNRRLNLAAVAEGPAAAGPGRGGGRGRGGGGRRNGGASSARGNGEPKANAMRPAALGQKGPSAPASKRASDSESKVKQPNPSAQAAARPTTALSPTPTGGGSNSGGRGPRLRGGAVAGGAKVDPTLDKGASPAPTEEVSGDRAQVPLVHPTAITPAPPATRAPVFTGERMPNGSSRGRRRPDKAPDSPAPTAAAQAASAAGLAVADLAGTSPVIVPDDPSIHTQDAGRGHRARDGRRGRKVPHGDPANVPSKSPSAAEPADGWSSAPVPVQWAKEAVTAQQKRQGLALG